MYLAQVLLIRQHRSYVQVQTRRLTAPQLEPSHRSVVATQDLNISSAHCQKYMLSAIFGSDVPKIAPSTSIQAGTTRLSGATGSTGTPSSVVASSTHTPSRVFYSLASSDESRPMSVILLGSVPI